MKAISSLLVTIFFCIWVCIACNPLNVNPDLEKGFIKYYGGASRDIAADLALSTDGGYVFIGTSESFSNGQSDVLLAKTDAAGKLLWQRNFGGVFADSGKAIKAIPGGYVAVGSISDSVRSYMYVLRLTENGDTLWTRKITINNAKAWGNDILPLQDGGFAVAGSTLATTPGSNTQAFIVKINNNGFPLPFQVIRGFENNYTIGKKVIEINDNGEDRLVWMGNSSTGNPPGTFVLVRNRNDGQEEFAYQKSENFLNELSITNATDFKKSNDGSYLLTGVSINAGTPKMYFLRLGNNLSDSPAKVGNMQTFGGSASSWGSKVWPTMDGGCVLVGTMVTAIGGQDVYLVKLDANANVQFERTFGGNGVDNGIAVIQTHDGGYSILATLSLETTPNNNPIISLIKVNVNGEITNR